MKKRLLIEKTKKWLTKNYIFVLICFIVLSSLITITIGLVQSVWFDEAYSINLAKRPIAEIIRLTSVDVHPPLYYILLHLWSGIFGWGELALRSLSVIFMSGSIFIGGILTKKLFGLRAAYFVTPILAFSPILMRYGFEIRMYSLASLIGILATYLLVMYVNSKDIKKRNLYLIFYSVFVALGMFTLYYMALLWLAHFVWLIWMTYKNKWPIIKSGWIFAYIGSILIFAIWLPFFIKQISGGALAPISQSMTVENLIGVISFNFLYRPVWQLGAIFAPIIIILIVTINHMIFVSNQKSNTIQKNNLSLMALYILLPIAILTFVGLFKPMYTERYLSHIAIGGLIFVAVILSISSRGSKIKTVLSLLFVVACLCIGVARLANVGNYNFQRLQKPEVKKIVSQIPDCNNREIIFAADPYVAIELDYYVDSCDIYFYSLNDNLSGGYAPLSTSDFRVYDVEKQVINVDTIFYIYYGEPKIDMPRGFYSVQKISDGGLNLEKYKL